MKKLKDLLLGRLKMTIILPFLIAIVVVVLMTSKSNVREVESQTWTDLADVAGQNAIIVDTRINSQYELINSIATELRGVTKDTISDKLSHFEFFMDECHYKRFAFCFSDGDTYSTDGDATDLSYRKFFDRGMDGKCSITGMLEDAIQGDNTHVNVMTVPVYEEDGTITGVFGVAYDTQDFNDSIQVECFDGKGYGCIVNEDRGIVATIGCGDFEISKSIDDEIKRLSGDENSIQALDKVLESDEKQKCVITLSEENYCYSVPVSLMDGSVNWHVITIIPSDVLMQKVTPIQKNQYVLSIWVLALAVAGALLLIIAIIGEHEQAMNAIFKDPITNDTSYAKFEIDMEKHDKTKGVLIALDIVNFNNISIVAGEDASEYMI